MREMSFRQITDLNTENARRIERIKYAYNFYGFPVPGSVIDLHNDQNLIQTKVDQYRIYKMTRNQLGWYPLVILAVTGLASLGTIVWSQYQKTKQEEAKANAQIAKASCVTSLTDPNVSDEDKARICGVIGDDSSGIGKTVEKYMSYAMILVVAYIGIKLIK